MFIKFLWMKVCYLIWLYFACWIAIIPIYCVFHCILVKTDDGSCEICPVLMMRYDMVARYRSFKSDIFNLIQIDIQDIRYFLTKILRNAVGRLLLISVGLYHLNKKGLYLFSICCSRSHWHSQVRDWSVPLTVIKSTWRWMSETV